MKKRRGADKYNDQDKDTYVTPEERALMSLPEHLRKSHSKKSEEMLSSQMLSGIPEVDLGIEEKIRNIEATESAKKKVAEDRMKQKSRPSEFVPTNLAVNFKEPNRFKVEAEQEVPGLAQDSSAANKPVTIQKTVVVGELPAEQVIQSDSGTSNENDPTRATDDLHLTKFKKHFQRK